MCFDAFCLNKASSLRPCQRPFIVFFNAFCSNKVSDLKPYGDPFIVFFCVLLK